MKAPWLYPPEDLEATYIWHVASESHSGLILWQVDDHTFKVVAKGEYTPLLTNPFYFLLHQKYLPALAQLSDQVTTTKVRVLDHVAKTSHEEYVQLIIKNALEKEDILSASTDGLQIWRFNDYIFVTAAVVQLLLEVCEDELVFSPGLSGFG